jgi:ribonuclease HI
MKQIIIFSDGSSKGNPGPGGWGAIILSDGMVIEIGGADKHTTNNRMELLAIISALESLGHSMSKLGEIVINTDSSYVINGITKWVKGWQKNNWKTKQKTDVVNKDLWKKLIEVSVGRKIIWNHVGGHIGVPGNERCDEIANAFADGGEIKLFNGKFSEYTIDLSDIKGNSVKKKNKSNSKVKAYSYLSLVNGVFHKDNNWKDCEKRVKGVKGSVKFKKSISIEDENEIMKEWKLN